MRYGELVRDALSIAWRNKFLWFFGFFVSISSFSGGGGGGNSGGSGTDDTPMPQDFDFDQSIGSLSSFSTNAISEPVASAKSIAAAAPLLIQNDGTIFFVGALILIFLIVVIIFIALNLISQAALAEGVTAIKGGSSRRFGQAFGIGLSYLLRLFLQGILFILIAFAILIAVFVVAGIPIVITFVASESIGLRIANAVIFGIIGVLLLIVLFIPLAIISQLAVRDLVVGGSGISSSIGAAYRLFRSRLGSVLLVWLLNLGLKILAGVVLFIALLIAGLILIGPGIGIYAAGAEPAGILVGVIGGIIFFILLLITSGAVGTFIHSYWTLAYLQLTGRSEPPPQTQPVPTPQPAS